MTESQPQWIATRDKNRTSCSTFIGNLFVYCVTLLSVTLFFVSPACFAADSPPRSIEPWADTNMPVREGLELWLDASTLPAAAAARGHGFAVGAITAEQGPSVPVWYDGSGARRDLEQSLQDHRPQLVRLAAGPQTLALRFDGKDDVLLRSNPEGASPQLTLFVVASPRKNPGLFSAFAATNRRLINDYVSGFNLDLGPNGSATWNVVNAEGIGFQGAQNLRTDSVPLGTFQVISLAIREGDQGVRLFMNGKPHGTRPRTSQPIALDQFLVGARYYSNSATPPHATGHLDGEVAELLLYRRHLSDDERQQVEQYLQTKHRELLSLPPDRSGSSISRSVSKPPEVQILQPDFEVRRLPLELTNINNLRVGPQGEILALAYDGNIFRLEDTDGDGIEDRAHRWWDNQGRLRSPIGMAVLHQHPKFGSGVLVAAKGKVSAISDRDGDGTAETETVVATGWRELTHNVDALGVAVDRDGQIFFGLGTADFTNPYGVNAEGQTQYDLASERGTVLKVAADGSRREIFCTGIRFPVGLAFHPDGELFCTDQEGATWLPNGNPFDELLHLQKGRHYGFPPRHSRYLPQVIDEPSTFDYGPQHQSTCGLTFNAGPRSFGPAWWRNSALVAGYSRGKLYRTTLVKTAQGYVASNQLLGCFQRLVADACVTPEGGLLVATHSGDPDWGSGPAGQGSLYRVTYRESGSPQPVAAWAASPREWSIAFDRPWPADRLSGFQNRVWVEQGKYVAAGDRFETLRPGYQVVQMQVAQPRRALEVQTVSLSPDRTVLTIRTEPAAEAVGYAITIPQPARPHVTNQQAVNQPAGKPPLGIVPAPTTTDLSAESKIDSPAQAANNTITSLPETDLGLKLEGIAAHWQPADRAAEQADYPPIDGWWPHFDPLIRDAVLQAWPGQPDWNAATHQHGEWQLRTQLRLDHFLRPATQPGSEITDKLPAEHVTVRWECSHPIALRAAELQIEQGRTKSGKWFVQGTTKSNTASADTKQPSSGWIDVELRITTGAPAQPMPDAKSEDSDAAAGELAAFTLTVTCTTSDDPRPRPLSPDRLLLPWARSVSDREAPLALAATDSRLASGDWNRGRALFYGPQAQCGKCHAVAGIGGTIGPDLTNLVHRDYNSVHRDVTRPNAALNPDYVAHQVELTDGRVLTGTLRSRGESLLLGDAQGREWELDRDQIERLVPQAISIMPEGLLKSLTETEQTDLFAFLLTAPPEEFSPATIVRPGAPPARDRNLLAQLQLPIDAAPAKELRPLHIVLLAGPKDHGDNEHDYPQWQRRWNALLRRAPNVQVDTAMGWPTPQQWKTADVIVLYSANPDWNPERAKQVDEFQARGGGLVLLHYAVNGQRAPDQWAERIGLAWEGGRSKFRHGPVKLTVHSPDHPLLRNVPAFDFEDESYWDLVGDPQRVNVLASQIEEDRERPILWTYQRGSGRVFVSILGHYSWTFDDPVFRTILLRSISWAGQDSVDRFRDLIPIGTRTRVEVRK